MKLTDTDKDILLRMGYPKKVKLSTGEFYVKMVNNEVAVKELIGYYFAKAIGLETAEVEIVAIDNGELYCLSKDLANEGTFYPISSLEEINTSFYDVWDLFQKKFKNVESLMSDFVKVYIMDVFLLNTDRNFENFGVRVTSDEEKLCILDHDLILEKICYWHLTPKVETGEVIGDDKIYREEQLENFLKVSSQEFVDVFLEVYRLFTPTFFYEILKMIKINNKLAIEKEEELKQIYLNNYNHISEILCRNNLLDSKRI